MATHPQDILTEAKKKQLALVEKLEKIGKTINPAFQFSSTSISQLPSGPAKELAFLTLALNQRVMVLEKLLLDPKNAEKNKEEMDSLRTGIQESLKYINNKEPAFDKWVNDGRPVLESKKNEAPGEDFGNLANEEANVDLSSKLAMRAQQLVQDAEDINWGEEEDAKVPEERTPPSNKSVNLGSFTESEDSDLDLDSEPDSDKKKKSRR